MNNFRHNLTRFAESVRNLLQRRPKRRKSANFEHGAALEVLEDRKLLTRITFNGRNVEITGTNAPESVEVKTHPTKRWRTAFYVNGRLLRSRTTSHFSQIIYKGNGGDDYFRNFTSRPSTAYGGNGDDRLIGGASVDQLFGGSGKDALYGGGGNDKLYGGSHNDWLNGGNGNDLMYGQDGDDGLYGSNGADLLDGGKGNDTLKGRAGNDRLRGGDGNDTLYGGAHNDTLYGDRHTDHIYGGTGNDYIHGGTWGDFLYGQAGSDTIYGAAGSDYIEGGTGHDVINGAQHDDTIYGDNKKYSKVGAGNDTIRGGDGNDFIHGGHGNDLIYGEGGDDKMLFGSTGNDVIYGGDGNDHIDGASGNDRLRGGDGNDTLYGGAHNDTIYGDRHTDYIYGGTGNDYIHGGTWGDFLYGQAGSDTIYGAAGSDYIEGGTGHDVINGAQHDDTIYGDNKRYSKVGAGNDTIRGGDGNDFIHGGHGNDLIYGEGGDDKMLFGSTGNDVIYGGDGNDHIDGASGNDRLRGGDGRDTIFGGAHNDTIYGDSDTDTVYGGPGNDYIHGGTWGDFLYGQEGADTIYGASGNDHIEGGEGDDLIDGAAGADMISYRHAPAGVLIDLSDGTAATRANPAAWGIDSIQNVENAVGSQHNDVIKGNDSTNILDGGSGADELYGYGGVDHLYGTSNEDWLDGGSGGDSIHLSFSPDVFIRNNGRASFSRNSAIGDHVSVTLDVSAATVWLNDALSEVHSQVSKHIEKLDFLETKVIDFKLLGRNIVNKPFGFGGGSISLGPFGKVSIPPHEFRIDLSTPDVQQTVTVAHLMDPRIADTYEKFSRFSEMLSALQSRVQASGHISLGEYQITTNGVVSVSGPDQVWTTLDNAASGFLDDYNIEIVPLSKPQSFVNMAMGEKTDLVLYQGRLSDFIDADDLNFEFRIHHQLVEVAPGVVAMFESWAETAIDAKFDIGLDTTGVLRDGVLEHGVFVRNFEVTATNAIKARLGWFKDVKFFKAHEVAFVEQQIEEQAQGLAYVKDFDLSLNAAINVPVTMSIDHGEPGGAWYPMMSGRFDPSWKVDVGGAQVEPVTLNRMFKAQSQEIRIKWWKKSWPLNYNPGPLELTNAIIIW